MSTRTGPSASQAVRELGRQGHRTLFLEHDKPWYAGTATCPFRRLAERRSTAAHRAIELAAYANGALHRKSR